MRVAAGQICSRSDDPVATRDTLTGAVETAAAAGADLVVLPELVTSGSVFRDPSEAMARSEPVDGPSVTRLRALSRQHGLVLVAGFCETASGERPYNSAVVIDHGEVLSVYRKTHLWNTEKLIFASGDEPPPVVQTSTGRLGVIVCYDLEFPEVTRQLARQGAQVIVAPANWPLLPKPEGALPIEIAKAQAAAAQNRVFVVVADLCGIDRGQEWTGGSVICDVSGYLLAGPRLGEPYILTASIDPAAADNKGLGTHNDVFADLRPELYDTTP